MTQQLRFPRINVVIISGRLTRDVELRYLPNGTPVAKLPIAFDRSYQKDGQWMKESSYTDITVWGKRAEQCGEELHKGSPVLIEGYLRTRTYTDSNNQNRKITEIVSNKVSFLERAAQPAAPASQPDDHHDSYQSTSKPAGQISDDDVPF
ncbi:MAG: single-stranded DNA-binding protein [Candidatus Cloacimonetes bacterium]|nr:single-stranded DNA-binding protein [Candidatus Cloacimonadota bacterium]